MVAEARLYIHKYHGALPTSSRHNTAPLSSLDNLLLRSCVAVVILNVRELVIHDLKCGPRKGVKVLTSEPA